MKHFFALTAIVAVMLSSCKKDKENMPRENVLTRVSPTTALSTETLAGNYRLEKVIGEIDLLPVEDLTNSIFASCQKDDIITLNADYSFIYTDAGEQCTAACNSEGTWRLPGNNKIELFNKVFDVKNWDGINLYVSKTEAGTDNQRIILTYMYVKQE